MIEAGGRLDSIPVVYHTSGKRDGKVVWICHALTANSDPEDPHGQQRSGRLVAGNGRSRKTD